MKCTKCRKENPQDAKFCNECAAPLIPESQNANSTPFREAERKRVTALFSDLSGYTAMTTKLDPEEVKEITSRIFDGTRAIIKKYEGFIERFAGDGFLALFGVPKAHEDDPIRAIRAAREIHKFVESLNPSYQKKVGRPLTMHSGINTGLAVTADVNPEKGTHGVTGEAVNLGARLSDLADAGDILVGEETYRASRERFTFETLEPVKVKGKAEPVPIYKLLSEKAPLSSVTSGRQVSSEMVGRDRELAKLELQVMKAMNGDGSVVNVIGEAGIGKSRLMAELKRRQVMQRVTLLEGRAISIGKNLSFHPIIDLLKQWAEILEDDAEAGAFHKLEKAIRSVHPQEVDEILPFLATLMGMKLTGRHAQRVKGIEGEALEKLILKNLRDLLIQAAELQPTIILMEDLHWADRSSLELLDSLYPIAEKHPMVFINVFRPGYLDAEDANLNFVGQRSRYHTEIEIKPLEKSDGEALIRNMLDIKGLPHSVSEQIVERAGGNPFFIEEVVRSFIDDESVIMTENGFEVTEKINHVVIPPTINDVLIARIDRLEDQTKELVKMASVIGRSFFVRILKEIANSIEGIDDRLAYLKNVQLIRDRVRMEEIEYLFKHALAQEAAYESTLVQQRKSLHLKVAQSIENVFQERLHEFYGMLAFHYSKADEQDKAEEYMIRAGEEALKASASNEALNYFRDTLKLYLHRFGEDAELEKVIEFKKRLAQAHFIRGNFWEAISLYDQILVSRGNRLYNGKLISFIKMIIDFIAIVLNLYSPMRRKPRIPDRLDLEVIDLHYKKAHSLWVVDSRKSFFEALAALKMSLCLDIPNTPLHKELVSAASIPFIASGKVSLSKKLIKRAEDYLVDEIGIWSAPLAAARILLAYRSGAWDSEPSFDPSLLDFAYKTGEKAYFILYLYALGNTKTEQGLWDLLDLYARTATYIVDKYAFELAQICYHNIKTIKFIRKGNLNQAIAEADSEISLTDKVQYIPHHLRAIANKVIIQALLGETEQAKSSILQGERILAKQKMAVAWYIIPFQVGQLLTYIGFLKKAVKDGNRSGVQSLQRKFYREAKKTLRISKKFAPYRTWIFKIMGDYYWLIDKQSKAFKWWEKSIQEGERLGARPDLSRTYFEVGKCLLDPKSKHKKLSGIDATGYLEKAQILFEEMGLNRDLEELRAVRSLG